MIPIVSAPVAAQKQATPNTALPPQQDLVRATFEKDAPTGPPPAFEESFLARQAREALTPPEMSNAARGKPDAAPDNEPDKRALSGFAEIRALGTEPAQALMDKRT